MSDIRFGALCPPLHEQLGVPQSRTRALQQMADGIAMCAIHGVLSEAEVHRARERLMKKIALVVKRG